MFVVVVVWYLAAAACSHHESKAKASIISIVYIVSDPISSRLTCIGSNSTNYLVAPKIIGPADKVR